MIKDLLQGHQNPNHRRPLWRQLAPSIIKRRIRTGWRKRLRHKATCDPHLHRLGPVMRFGRGRPAWLDQCNPSRARGGGGGRQASTQPPLLSPVRAPPLQEGPGRGHRPVTEAENGAENPNQPFVHTRPKQQRRPTHPETQTPELSPPLPPSPPQQPQPRFSR